MEDLNASLPEPASGLRPTGDDPARLALAIKVAVDAHAGQVDKAGQPYILHPLRVMLACKSEDERIAAILHDTVEDTDVSIDQIAVLFGEPIAAVVDALSRRDGETYEAFIQRCAANRVARKVKLADLADNMNLDRLGREPTMADARRQWRYGEARNALAQAERDSDTHPTGGDAVAAPFMGSAGRNGIAQTSEVNND